MNAVSTQAARARRGTLAIVGSRWAPTAAAIASESATGTKYWVRELVLQQIRRQQVVRERRETEQHPPRREQAENAVLEEEDEDDRDVLTGEQFSCGIGWMTEPCIRRRPWRVGARAREPFLVPRREHR